MSLQIVNVAHSLAVADFPNLEELRGWYGWNDRNHRIFDRMYALKSTSLHLGQSLEKILTISAQKLVTQSPDLYGAVDYLLYCHALNTPIVFADDLLARIADRVFGSRPEVHSVSHASCASALFALEMLEAMDNSKVRNVVILTGEKCFFELLDYAENKGLFGEASAAAHVRLGTAGGIQVAAVSTGCFPGIFSPVPRMDKEAAAKFDHDFIPMVFGCIKRVLGKASVDPQDIDAIFPTHLSPYTGDRLATQMGIPTTRVFKENLPRIGHCYCSDMFINLQSWRRPDEDISRSSTVLAYVAGMTGSYAAIILKLEPEAP